MLILFFYLGDTDPLPSGCEVYENLGNNESYTVECRYDFGISSDFFHCISVFAAQKTINTVSYQEKVLSLYPIWHIKL